MLSTITFFRSATSPRTRVSVSALHAQHGLVGFFFRREQCCGSVACLLGVLLLKHHV